MSVFKRLRAWWVATRPTSPEARFGTRETIEREEYARYLAKVSNATRRMGAVNIDGSER